MMACSIPLHSPVSIVLYYMIIMVQLFIFSVGRISLFFQECIFAYVYIICNYKLRSAAVITIHWLPKDLANTVVIL